MEYRPRQTPSAAVARRRRVSAAAPERMRKLFEGRDRVGEFLRTTLPPSLTTPHGWRRRSPTPIDDVDRAMRWGYGWPLGPLELADASSRQSARATRSVRRSGHSRRCIASNAGASLIDLGDGVLCVSLHSKMNAIGGDALQMLQRGVREASSNFAALVVGTEAANFSAGANLMLLLLEAREGNWDEIDRDDPLVSTGHHRTSLFRCAGRRRRRAASRLAEAARLCFTADRIQAAAETYMGLVEAGVGLIPAAGGCKEMVLRKPQHAEGVRDHRLRKDVHVCA